MTSPCDCKRYRTDGRHVARFDPALDCRACWEAAVIRKANLAAGGDGRVLPVGDLGAARPAAMGATTTKPAARVGLPLLRPPCAHEGPVVEGCRTCGTAADREARHVRLCGHPTADRDKCTRDHPGSLLQRCGTCPDYEAAAPPTGNAAG